MRLRSLSGLALLSAAVFASGKANATDFYVDPANGSMSGDGSSLKPWRTIEEVFAANLFETQTWSAFPYVDGAALVPKNPGAPIKAGDAVYLRDGFHGAIDISDFYNASDVTIAAAPGATPHLAYIKVQGGSHFHFRGLAVSSSYAATYDATQDLITLLSPGYQGPAHDITVDGCFVESVPDTSMWTGDQWLTLPANGINATGDHHVITNNHLHNVRFAISVSATNTLVDTNVIDSFGNGDGMRGIGDDCTFQYNVVKNAHHPDPNPSNGNHDDGFQSWSTGVDPSDGQSKPGFGTIKNIVLRGNLVISHEADDPPFVSEMQGIDGFDGMYQGFVVENNVVISSTYHGISFYGCIDCRIVNNTVLDRVAGDAAVPWIMIHDHKNGTVSTGGIVRNNLTTTLSIQSANQTQDHNFLIVDPAALFVGPTTFDAHLLATATDAIDQGSADQAPLIDKDGIARPQGAGFDLGAYEWHLPDVTAAGAAGTSASGGSAGAPTSAGGSSVGSAGSIATSGGASTGGHAGQTNVAGAGAKPAGASGSGGAAGASANAASSSSSGGCDVATGGGSGGLFALAALFAARRRRSR